MITSPPLILLFCSDRFWNQGKTIAVETVEQTGFCSDRFWNQGKTQIGDELAYISFCSDRFWNQGKTPKR